MNAIERTSQNIANALSSAGADVHSDASGLSDSLYVHAQHDEIITTVRVSDHELPVSYQGDRGEDFRTEVVLGTSLGGNWLDATIWSLQILGLTPPPYLRRLLTIRENDRAVQAARYLEADAQAAAYQTQRENDVAALAERISDNVRARVASIDASDRAGKVRRRQIGRIAADYNATAGLLRAACSV